MSATQVFFGAPAPVTERGTPASFDVTPDGQFAVYGNKRNVVVRHLYNPGEGFIRTGHKKACRVARVSPDGKWCASADAAGKIQIWDFQKATHDISLEKVSIFLQHNITEYSIILMWFLNVIII